MKYFYIVHLVCLFVCLFICVFVSFTQSFIIEPTTVKQCQNGRNLQIEICWSLLWIVVYTLLITWIVLPYQLPMPYNALKICPLYVLFTLSLLFVGFLLFASNLLNWEILNCSLLIQAWKKCRARDLGSDKTADFGIKFGENAILVRVSRIKFTFWGINRMG